MQGYRVIALATKELTSMTEQSAQTCKREEIETGLTFLGFLIFENKLK